GCCCCRSVAALPSVSCWPPQPPWQWLGRPVPPPGHGGGATADGCAARTAPEGAVASASQWRSAMPSAAGRERHTLTRSILSPSEYSGAAADTSLCCAP
ncbi:unnamed protein product, partial [Ectocarpus sp. 8 AP-2014]